MTRAAAPARRIYVNGGSGSGTTTLGRALASAWAVPHADTDDYYWLPTAPPYTDPRDVADRLRLMEEVFLGRDAWVLSGSLTGWGDPLTPYFDGVVFLTLDAETRLARLQAREAARYGAEVAPGGAREHAFLEFMDWAARYEDPEFDGRSLATHERWISTLTCPVLRLDGARPVGELVRAVSEWCGA